MRSGVRHGQRPRPRVLEREILIPKFRPVHRFPSRAVVIREVPALNHKVRYHSVERAVGVRQPVSALVRAELSEILTGFRHDVASELNRDPPDAFATDRDVEKDARQRRHRVRFGARRD